MERSKKSYTPALGHHWLTRFYDPVVRLTTRESTFKPALLRQAAIQNRHRVLDLGCGTGTLPMMVKRNYPDTEVLGFDADHEVLTLARKKLDAAGLRVQLDEGLVSALPYHNESFDRVLSSLLLHHLASEVKQEAIHEVLRVLRPGGEFHIADWGRPTNPVMRLVFVPVQLLDGFATTADNVKGLLPDFLQFAGFEHVDTTASYSTVFGTLSLYRAKKPLETRSEKSNSEDRVQNDF